MGALWKKQWRAGLYTRFRTPIACSEQEKRASTRSHVNIEYSIVGNEYTPLHQCMLSYVCQSGGGGGGGGGKTIGAAFHTSS